MPIIKNGKVVYDIEDLCLLEREGEQWLVNNVFPRCGKVMAYGHGSSFKTTVIYDLAVAVAGQGAFLRQYKINEHGPVLLVSTEGDKFSAKERIFTHVRARDGYSPELYTRRKPFTPNKREFPLHYCRSPFDFSNTTDAGDFIEIIEEIKPIFVLLDPLDSFITGNENDASDTRHFRRFCDDIVERFNLCLTVIHHSKKGETPSLRGSSAWRGWIDTSLLFLKKQYAINGETFNYIDVFGDKQRDGEEGLLFSALPEVDNVRGVRTFAILHNGFDPDVLAINKVQEDIYKALASRGPLTQKEIIDITKHSHPRIKLGLERLYADGAINDDVIVQRSTSADGSRQRGVQAWQISGKICTVDLFSALLKLIRKEADVLEETYTLEAYPLKSLSPVSLNAGGQHIGGVSTITIPEE